MAKTSLRGKVKNIFSGNKNKKTTSPVNQYMTPVPIRTPASSSKGSNFSIINPRDIDIATNRAKPTASGKEFAVNPWYAYVDVGQKTPKVGNVIPLKGTPYGPAKQQGPSAPAATQKQGGGGQAPAAPATPPPPTSPLQDTVDRLLSRAGYASSYKPKKDSLANTQKDQTQRYLSMYGPFKSIE